MRRTVIHDWIHRIALTMPLTSISVLGCGRIGRMHARMLAQHRKARLVSLYDLVAETAAETSRELGVRLAKSLAEVLGDSGVAARWRKSTPFTPSVDLQSTLRRICR